MLQRFEGHFRTTDQAELFFQTWTGDRVRGTLIITHGLAEHSECYHQLARALSEDGWQVFAWDMRGHGRSEGKRGFVKDLSYYVDDLEKFFTIVQMQKGVSDNSLVLFGHSLGALVTTRFLQTRKPPASACALSSPCFGLTVEVPKFKEKLAHVAMKWMPTLTMFNEIQYRDLSRDQQIIESYTKDNLRHDKISPGLFLSMLANFPLVLQDAPTIDIPVLMQISGEDRVVSPQAARDFFEKLTNKKSQLHIYPESMHEIFNDLDRDQALQDLKKFLNPYLGA